MRAFTVLDPQKLYKNNKTRLDSTQHDNDFLKISISFLVSFIVNSSIMINPHNNMSKKEAKYQQFTEERGGQLKNKNSNLLFREQIYGFINQKMKRKINDYQLQEKQLGSGGQGIVYLAKLSLTKRFALKVSQIPAIDKIKGEIKDLGQEQLEKRKDQFRKRAAKHVMLEHKNVVKAYEFMMMDQEKKLVTVLELCEGTLSSWIGTADEEAQSQMMEKISNGLKYLHEQGVVHHDLKPGNILLKNGEPKIADLDGAVLLKVKSVKYGDADFSQFGTTDYLAPEVFRKKKFGRKADVWSMGVIFFEILTGKRIYQLREEGLIDKRSPGQIEGFFSPEILGMIKNEKLRKLVKGMLDEKTENRFGSQKVQQQVYKILGKEHPDTISIPPKLDQRETISDMNKNQFIDFISRNLIFSQCTFIDLQNNQITDDGLEALVENGHKFSQLQKIYLENNEITDAGLQVFVENGLKFPLLSRIYLHSNQITSEGLKAFVENGHTFLQLQEINLSRNKITNEGLEELVDNGHNFPQLQAVYLWKNPITDTGLIFRARKYCKINITL